MRKLMFAVVLLCMVASATAISISCAPGSIRAGSESTCTVSSIAANEKNEYIEWRDAGGNLQRKVQKCTSEGTCRDTYSPISTGTWTISYPKGSNPTTSINVYECVDTDFDGYYVNTYGGVCGTLADCDDTRATVYPGRTEFCDGLDTDCDGEIDDGVKETFYADKDGDGYGNIIDTILACRPPPTGYVIDSTDCDDSESLANPSELEVCDTIDNNCDGEIDEMLLFEFYADSDRDGYGAGELNLLCSDEGGFSTNDLDCDDNDEDIHPGATEILNDGRDQNCNGIKDDTNTIPEFATITALLALGGAAAIVFAKRRKA
jgi:hypothetical protein